MAKIKEMDKLGRLTIPKPFRKKLNWNLGDSFWIAITGKDEVTIKKVTDESPKIPNEIKKPLI